MTFEELNVVRELKKQIRDEKQKIQALRDCAESMTQKYSRETLTNPNYPKIKKSYTTLNTLPKGGVGASKVENFSIMIIDSENKVAELLKRLDDESKLLVYKIQHSFSQSIEQTILLYRYVLCKPFNEISKILKYSNGYVRNIHAKILKKCDMM